VHKAVETATKAGAFVKQPPMEIPGGMIAILGDPQGAGFAVHAVGGAMAAPKPLAKTTQKPASRPKAKATASRKKAKAAPAKKKTAAKKKAPARKAAARKKRTKR
jgi:hypothetical protein